MSSLQKSLVSLLLLSAVGLSGCTDNPGTWSEQKVASQIEESLELVESSLTKVDGGFEGTGKRSDGETLTFTIQQDPDASRMSWDAKGDRGFVEDGFYELK